MGGGGGRGEGVLCRGFFNVRRGPQFLSVGGGGEEKRFCVVGSLTYVRGLSFYLLGGGGGGRGEGVLCRGFFSVRRGPQFLSPP